jgi:outer membrane immunogenic protein
MKRELSVAAALLVSLSTAVFAADRPIYKAAPPVAPAFSWTGCYAGLNAGYVRGHSHWINVGVGTDDATVKPDGFIGGGQIGCDYQVNQWVLGIEGMFDGSAAKDTKPDPNVPGDTETDKLRWFGTLTGRIGYAFDKSLLYAKGGVAWTHLTHQFFSTVTGIDDITKTRTGWVAGGGWEWMFAPNWSAKIEYNHIEFNDFTAPLPNVITTMRFIDHRFDMVMVGLNYRFGSR